MNTAPTRLLKTVSEEDQKQLMRFGAQIFDEMAGDLLQLLAEEGKYEIKQADVIETVLDAGRLHQLCKQRGRPDLAQTVDELTYAELKRLMRKQFPFKSYA